MSGVKEYFITFLGVLRKILCALRNSSWRTFLLLSHALISPLSTSALSYIFCSNIFGVMMSKRTFVYIIIANKYIQRKVTGKKRVPKILTIQTYLLWKNSCHFAKGECLLGALKSFHFPKYILA